jgi:hypothetical protein
MTFTQKQAIWELCRQGLHDAAAQAEQSWEGGEPFEPELPLPLTRQIALLIDCANWEARRNGVAARMARADSLTAQRFSAAA